jgi:hypothetical protein
MYLLHFQVLEKGCLRKKNLQKSVPVIIIIIVSKSMSCSMTLTIQFKDNKFVKNKFQKKCLHWLAIINRRKVFIKTLIEFLDKCDFPKLK